MTTLRQRLDAVAGPNPTVREHVGSRSAPTVIDFRERPFQLDFSHLGAKWVGYARHRNLPKRGVECVTYRPRWYRRWPPLRHFYQSAFGAMPRCSWSELSSLQIEAEEAKDPKTPLGSRPRSLSGTGAGRAHGRDRFCDGCLVLHGLVRRARALGVVLGFSDQKNLHQLCWACSRWLPCLHTTG